MEENAYVPAPMFFSQFTRRTPAPTLDPNPEIGGVGTKAVTRLQASSLGIFLCSQGSQITENRPILALVQLKPPHYSRLVVRICMTHQALFCPSSHHTPLFPIPSARRARRTGSRRLSGRPMVSRRILASSRVMPIPVRSFPDLHTCRLRLHSERPTSTHQHTSLLSSSPSCLRLSTTHLGSQTKYAGVLPLPAFQLLFKDLPQRLSAQQIRRRNRSPPIGGYHRQGFQI